MLSYLTYAAWYDRTHPTDFQKKCDETRRRQEEADRRAAQRAKALSKEKCGRT